MNFNGNYVILSRIERIRSPLQERKFLEQRACFKSFCDNGSVCLAFHGTASKNLVSIADAGLLDPNHPKYVRATGNRYGKGIYVSKQFSYAKMYAKPSLLVVAILEGEHKVVQPRDATRNAHLPIEYNSILVGQETILQSNSQILPLFVVTFGSKGYSTWPELNTVPLFNFTDVLIKHMPIAQELKVLFPQVALGVLLHLTAQASDENEEDPRGWAIDYLTDYNLT